MKKFKVLSLMFLVIFVGCSTAKLPPVSSEKYAMAEDEKRIWRRSEEEQESIARSGLVYQEKRLTVYLNRIARKLQSNRVYERIPFKIMVLKNQYCNAFAYPNGVIYMHTGILARIENEAQLATLLAHEMTHATHRHQVIDFRNIKNKAVIASLVPGVGEIGAAASISGYQQDLEREADMVGIKLVLKAGYDIQETPKLFHHLKQEMEEEGVKEDFFFGSHPRLQERIDNYNQFLKNSGKQSGNKKNQKQYEKYIGNLLLVNSTLDLQAGRFKTAQKAIDRYISINPKKPQGYYLQGKFYQQRGTNGDIDKSIKSFKRAIFFNRRYADAYKSLGFIFFKQAEKKKARKAFEKYLSLSKKASDKEFINQYIDQCK